MRGGLHNCATATRVRGLALSVVGVVALTAGLGSPLAASARSRGPSDSAAAGPADHLAFTSQPNNSRANTAFSSQPSVAVEDSSGNVVTTDSSPITLSITAGAGTSGAVLTACSANPLAASGGVASFSGCAIDKAGTGYTLSATDGTLTPAVSGAFDISAAGVATYKTQIYNPNGVAGIYPDGGAVDANGNMYITDSGNSQVMLLPSGATTPQVLVPRSFGLLDPRGMALDPDGQHFWVPDTNNNRLVEFNLDGTNPGPNGTVKSFGGSNAAGGSLKSPYGVVFDTSAPGVARNAYVADTYGYNVVAFNLTTAAPQVLWTAAMCNGKALTRTRGIGWGSDGYLYVTDTDNNRLVVLDPATGRCLGTIGTIGAGYGQFKAPRDVIGDPFNNGIWVADAGNYRIQHLGLLAQSGQYLGGSCAGRGSNDGQFIAPQTLFADRGLIAVSDTYNYDVEEFRINPATTTCNPDPNNSGSNGAVFLRRVAQGARPSGGGFNGAWSVAYDKDGNLYATDWFNHRVEKFDPQGNWLLDFGSYGSNPGQLEYPRGVAVSADGTKVAVAQENNNISIFDSNGTYLSQIKASGGFHRPRQVSFDPRDGTIWVADYGHNRVLHLSLTGKNIPFTPVDSIQMPQGVVVDASGNVYVSNTGRKLVEEYDSTGTKLIATLAGGTSPNHLISPCELALFGPPGSQELLITDSARNQVLAVRADGTADPNLTFGAPGSGGGQFQTPTSVAVNPLTNDIAVADLRNNRVSIWATS